MTARLAVAVVAALAFAPSALADAPWPMLGGDAQHTGDSPYSAAQTGALDWASTAAWDRTVQPINREQRIHPASKRRCLGA